jgi:hypothetical protein
MASESLKSIPIVNADAQPIIENALGSGAPGYLRAVNGHVAATTGVTSPSTYRLVRIPRDAKVKRIFLTNAALGGATAADISVAFSDSTTDGTSNSFVNLANPVIQTSGPIDNKLFGSAVSLVNAQKNQDQTFSNLYTTDLMNLPLWLALVNLGCTQFSTDPFGFFDLVLKTTTTVTAGGDLSLECWYVSSS